jgi:hypothetical protein
MAGSVLGPIRSGESTLAWVPDTGVVRPDEEYEQDTRGWSPVGVALIATLVLLLGLGGALFGIHVANRARAIEPGGTVTRSGPTLPPAPTVAATPTPTPTATSGATATPVAGAPFPLPDVVGGDFKAARTELRGLRLGVLLVFDGTGTDTSVRATEPTPGAAVRRGTTVKVFVSGAAPLATVPDVGGLTCTEAARRIVDAGLYPRYPRGRVGSVISQVPAATDPATRHWNDTVEIVCT